LVITADGRTLVGELLSCDQLTNIVLNNTIERIIQPAEDPEPSSEIARGLYLVRGDNITICGLVEEELDTSIDWTKVVSGATPKFPGQRTMLTKSEEGRSYRRHQACMNDEREAFPRLGYFRLLKADASGRSLDTSYWHGGRQDR
jgi:U6 snRNA-associated Sm-like protein LSm8